MNKVATVLVLAFLLISLLAAHGASARTLRGTSPDASSTDQETEFRKELQVDEDAVATEDPCETGISEDECLMRRSLAAHVDYIYTQKDKKP